MIAVALQVLRYAFTLLFGVAVSACFAGVDRTRKNYLTVGLFAAAAFLVQVTCWLLWGLDAAAKLYPLITHLPLIVLIAARLKRPWLTSVVSVLSAYLCCQVPRWIGDIAGVALASQLANDAVYLLAVILVYGFLRKHVIKSVRALLAESVESRLLFAAMPLLYYLFDYSTTIYSNLLYSGAEIAVQFMPAVVSVLYFAFAIRYGAATQKQAAIQRERDLLSVQLLQAHLEFASLRQMQQRAAALRHDLRHHVALLQSLVAEGNLGRVREYLNTVAADLDRITPTRFCQNETVNLILSSFDIKARQAGCSLAAEVRLPEELPVSDTELCSLFSNGLENAIAATAALAEPNQRPVVVKAWVHKGNLLISMVNGYVGKIAMHDGLPLSSRADHGIGARSIMAIANARGGQAIFAAEAGTFTLRIMLPLDALGRAPADPSSPPLMATPEFSESAN